MKITSSSQYRAALAKIESFIEKGFGNLTKKEIGRLKQISLSVKAYEKTKCPMPVTTFIPAVLEEYAEFEITLPMEQLEKIL